jgi:MraZ protein
VFLGTYDHSLDGKGRLVMPSKFRGDLDKGCVITKGQEHCLYVFPMARWEKETSRVSNLPRTDRRARKIARSLFAGASDLSLDRQGRIQIPEKLRGYASLEKDVTVVGSADHVEIWSTPVWEAEEAEADEYYSGIEEVLGLGGEEL